MKTILVVDHDNTVIHAITEVLSHLYHLRIAKDTNEAHEIFKEELIDVALIGNSTSNVDSLKLVGEFRDLSDLPIIVLANPEETRQTLRMIIEGANDYITKPIDMTLLITRIEGLLIAERKQEYPRILRFKNLRFDVGGLSVEIDGKPIDLSKKEIEILQILLKNPTITISKEKSYEEVWGGSQPVDENTVNVHISSIRKKIREVEPLDEYIQTVWGVGVKLAQPSRSY